MERSMFYGAKPDLFEKAKQLRANMTEAEKMLWHHLQKSKILGLRFKPQHPIDIFIADFYCHKIKLVIEVDGEIHNNKTQEDYDISRTDEMSKYGINVIRFTNKQIADDINRVVKEIVNICVERNKELAKKSALIHPKPLKGL